MNASLTTNGKSWSEERLRELFRGNDDVIFQACRFRNDGETQVVMVYAEGLAHTIEIGSYVLPQLNKLYDKGVMHDMPIEQVSGLMPIVQLGSKEEELFEVVFTGDLLLLFVETGEVGFVCMAAKPTRQPTESNTEISIKGPRDGFVEDMAVNIALIRKRLRSPSLQVEHLTLGRRSKTRIGLMYFRDILNPTILKEMKERLDRIDVDAIFSLNQMEELLSDSKFKLLPTMDFTGRPDYVMSSLLAGRIVVIVDGLPMVLIAPAGLSLIMKSPEDSHFNYTYVSFARIIRGISLFLSIFLPAIWVAMVTFHPDQLPYRMMATISVSRMGIPLSSHMEMFLLLLLLEIFREAGIRLPSAIGQTLTSIGGLIIGDAAIRAGLVSPSVVVIGAVTAVSGVTLVNQVLSTQVSLLRFFFFLLSAFLGLFGVILGMVLLLGYMGSLKPFGVPYLSPLSPPHFKQMLASFLRVPWTKLNRRPGDLHTIDDDKQKEDGA